MRKSGSRNKAMKRHKNQRNPLLHRSMCLPSCSALFLGFPLVPRCCLLQLLHHPGRSWIRTEERLCLLSLFAVLLLRCCTDGPDSLGSRFPSFLQRQTGSEVPGLLQQAMGKISFLWGLLLGLVPTAAARCGGTHGGILCTEFWIWSSSHCPGDILSCALVAQTCPAGTGKLMLAPFWDTSCSLRGLSPGEVTGVERSLLVIP